MFVYNLSSEYEAALIITLVCVIIAFWAMVREKEDLHRLILTDLVEIMSLVIIALVATDLAEALILPGLVVGIAELLALSELYIEKENLRKDPENVLHIEVMDSAPGILAVIFVIYGIILSGFTGGAVAGLGLLFYFMCRGSSEKREIIETVSGYAWACWVVAFIVFMALPQYWFFGVIIAGAGIFAKVAAKMSVIGTMNGGDSDV
ncbi:EhaG family protein [Methanolacinia paynteri]|uniref:EhaG family protein n=1 Tax=Methanolacinia paynteri TaxID=230356 RepID=UPI00064E2639|nr:EhaG family protein [Methanolacinia paynteri]